MKTVATQKLFIYIGHFLTGCMDFAIGVLIVSVVDFYSAGPLPLYAYALGIFLAVLPDMDLMSEIAKASDLMGWDHHQTLLHRPILILPFVVVVGILAGYFIGNTIGFTIIFFLCVLWHYIHDTNNFGGGGIAWFWPISKYYWYFFGKITSEESLMGKKESYQQWVRPTVLSVRELSIAVAALVVASFFDMRIVPVVNFLLPIFFFAVSVLWATSKRYVGETK